MTAIALQPVRIGGHVYSKVQARVETYAHGEGVAVQLDCDEEGFWEPLATATVNVEGDPRTGSLVWMRDSEENTGLIDSLAFQGLVRRTGLTRPSGWITLHEVELLGALRDLLEAPR